MFSDYKALSGLRLGTELCQQLQYIQRNKEMRNCSAGLGFRNRQSPFLSGHCRAAVLQDVLGRPEELILKDPNNFNFFIS